LSNLEHQQVFFSGERVKERSKGRNGKGSKKERSKTQMSLVVAILGGKFKTKRSGKPEVRKTKRRVEVHLLCQVLGAG